MADKKDMEEVREHLEDLNSLLEELEDLRKRHPNVSKNIDSLKPAPLNDEAGRAEIASFNEELQEINEELNETLAALKKVVKIETKSNWKNPTEKWSYVEANFKSVSNTINKIKKELTPTKTGSQSTRNVAKKSQSTPQAPRNPLTVVVENERKKGNRRTSDAILGTTFSRQAKRTLGGKGAASDKALETLLKNADRAAEKTTAEIVEYCKVLGFEAPEIKKNAKGEWELSFSRNTDVEKNLHGGKFDKKSSPKIVIKLPIESPTRGLVNGMPGEKNPVHMVSFDEKGVPTEMLTTAPVEILEAVKNTLKDVATNSKVKTSKDVTRDKIKTLSTKAIKYKVEGAVDQIVDAITADSTGVSLDGAEALFESRVGANSQEKRTYQATNVRFRSSATTVAEHLLKKGYVKTNQNEPTEEALITDIMTYIAVAQDEELGVEIAKSVLRARAYKEEVLNTIAESFKNVANIRNTLGRGKETSLTSRTISMGAGGYDMVESIDRGDTTRHGSQDENIAKSVASEVRKIKEEIRNKVVRQKEFRKINFANEEDRQRKIEETVSKKLVEKIGEGYSEKLSPNAIPNNIRSIRYDKDIISDQLLNEALDKAFEKEAKYDKNSTLSIKKKIAKNINAELYEKAKSAAREVAEDQALIDYDDPSQALYPILETKSDAIYRAISFATEDATKGIEDSLIKQKLVNKLIKKYKNEGKTKKEAKKIAHEETQRWFANYEKTQDKSSLSILDPKDWDGISKGTRLILADQFPELMPGTYDDQGIARSGLIKAIKSFRPKTEVHLMEDKYSVLKDKAEKIWDEKIKKVVKRGQNKGTFVYDNRRYNAQNDRDTFINNFIAAETIGMKHNEFFGNANIIEEETNEGKFYRISANQLLNPEGGQIKMVGDSHRGYEEELSNTMRQFDKVAGLALYYSIVDELSDENGSLAEAKVKERFKNIAAMLGIKTDIDNIDFSDPKAAMSFLKEVGSKIDDIREKSTTTKASEIGTNTIKRIRTSLNAIEKKEDKKKFIEGLKKTGLGGYIKNDDKTGYENILFENTEEARQALKSVGWGKINEEIGLLEKSILGFENPLTGRTGDENAFLYFGRANVPDFYEWNKRASVGQKEIAGLRRLMVASQSGDAFKKAVEAQFNPTVGMGSFIRKKAQHDIEQIQQALLKSSQTANYSDAKVKEIVASSFKTGVADRENSKTITIGSGDDYSINLDDFADIMADYKDGRVTEESFNDLIEGQVNDLRNEIIAKSGLTDVNEIQKLKDSIEVILDPGALQTITSGKNAYQYRLLHLGSIDPDEDIDALTGEKGYNRWTYSGAIKKLSKALKYGNEADISNAANEIVMGMNATATHNKGALYERANKFRIGHSASFHTSALNPLQVLNNNFDPDTTSMLQGVQGLTEEEKKSWMRARHIDSAFISRGAMRTLLSDKYGYDQDQSGKLTAAGEKAHLQSLFNARAVARWELEHGGKKISEALSEDEKKQFAETVNDEFEKFYSTKGDYSKKLNTLLGSYDDQNSLLGLSERVGLSGWEHRNPSIQNLPIKHGRIFANKSVRRRDVMKVGIGLAKLIKADFDGDMINGAIGMAEDITAHLQDRAQGYDEEIAEEIFKMKFATGKNAKDAKDRGLDYYVDKNGKIRQTRMSNKKFKEKQAKAERMAGHSFFKSLSETAAKINFENVGSFSNMSSAVRYVLGEKGFDAESFNITGDKTKDLESLKKASMGTVTQSLSQLLEQDAISSKKVQERIWGLIEENEKLDAKDPNKKTNEQIAGEVFNDYYKLKQDLVQGNFTSNQEVIDRFKKLGIIGKDGSVDAAASWEAVAQVKTMAKKAGLVGQELESFYKEIFGEKWQDIVTTGQINGNHLVKIMNATDKALGYKKGHGLWLKDTVANYDVAEIFKRANKQGKYKDEKALIENIKNAGGTVSKIDEKGNVVASFGNNSITVDAEGNVKRVVAGPEGSVTSAIGSAFGSSFPQMAGFNAAIDAISQRVGEDAYAGRELAETFGVGYGQAKNLSLSTSFGDAVHAAKEAYLNFKARGFKGTENFKTLSEMQDWLLEQEKIKQVVEKGGTGTYDQNAIDLLNEWREEAGTDHTQKAGVLGAISAYKKILKATSNSASEYGKKERDVENNVFALGNKIATASLSRILNDDGTFKKDAFIINEGSAAGHYVGKDNVEYVRGGQYDTLLGFRDDSGLMHLMTQDIKSRGDRNLPQEGKDEVQPLIYSYFLKQTHDWLQQKENQDKLSEIASQYQGNDEEILRQQKAWFQANNKDWKDTNKEIDTQLFKTLRDETKVVFDTAVQYVDRNTGQMATYLADLTKLDNAQGKEILDKILAGSSVISDEEKQYLSSIGALSLNPQEIGRAENYKASYQVEYEMMEEINKLLRERERIEESIGKLEERKKTVSDEEKESIDRLIALEQAKSDKLTDQIENKTAILSDEDKKALEVERRMREAAGAGGGDQKQPLLDSLGYNKQNLTRMITQYFSLWRVLGKVRQMMQRVVTITKQLDQAATNIRIVTGKEREEVDDLILSYSKLASQIGSTTTAVAQSANTWLRQGYNINEANKLITASTRLSKLGMLDINSATKVLTSTLKGFKMEASEATSIVDKFTKLDTKFAASAGEIGEALSRAASLAQQSGMSLDQASAFVTTIMDITQQSAEMAGTSLRTILARYGNVKAGSFVNADEDDVENINDIEKVLSRIGITIRSSNSDMRAFSDVLDDISEKWLYLTDVEKNAIATAVAGELAPEHTEMCA